MEQDRNQLTCTGEQTKFLNGKFLQRMRIIIELSTLGEVTRNFLFDLSKVN